MPQVSINPLVHEAPLYTCVDGPADGLEFRVPDGFILTCALTTPQQMMMVALPPQSDDVDIVEMMVRVGTYRGHYEVIEGALYFSDSREVPQ